MIKKYTKYKRQYYKTSRMQLGLDTLCVEAYWSFHWKNKKSKQVRIVLLPRVPLQLLLILIASMNYFYRQTYNLLGESALHNKWKIYYEHVSTSQFQTNLWVFIRLLKVSKYINRAHNFVCKKSKFHLQFAKFIFLVSLLNSVFPLEDIHPWWSIKS